MKKHKIYLEDLLDEIRTLGEDYTISHEDGEAFELETAELKPFKEEVLVIVKRFLSMEETEETEEDEDDDELDMFMLGDDDDLS